MAVVGKSPYFETELRTETTWEEEEVETVVRLVVRVRGAPRPAVRWYEDDREIVPGTEYGVDGPDDDGVSVLTVRERPSEECARVITCRAVNEHGTAETKTLLVAPGNYQKNEKTDQRPRRFS